MKKAINVVVAALLVISILGAALDIFTGPDKVELYGLIKNVVTIIIGVLILFYNFYGYKKPHGNLLRYLGFILGSTTILSTVIGTRLSICVFAITIAGILIVYMSGRLNKIEKNKVLVIVVLVLIAATVVMRLFNLDVFFGESSASTPIMPADSASISADITGSETPMQPQAISGILRYINLPALLFQWIGFSLAYISRFKEHKEAGLVDAPKKSENS